MSRDYQNALKRLLVLARRLELLVILDAVDQAFELLHLWLINQECMFRIIERGGAYLAFSNPLPSRLTRTARKYARNTGNFASRFLSARPASG